MITINARKFEESSRSLHGLFLKSSTDPPPLGSLKNQTPQRKEERERERRKESKKDQAYAGKSDFC